MTALFFTLAFMSALILPMQHEGEWVEARFAGDDIPSASDARDLATTLKAYDSDLTLGYSRSRARWIIKHKGADGMEMLVMVLETPEGGYRGPTQRVFEDVMKSNMRERRNRDRQNKAQRDSSDRQEREARQAKEAELEAMTEVGHREWTDVVARRAPMHRKLPRIKHR